MNIHTITCISDAFTDEEIKSTEKFVRRKLKSVEKLLKLNGGEEAGIVLYIKPTEVNFMPVGYSKPVHSLISNRLKKA